MPKNTVYVVQNSPRDHNGEVLLVTHDKSKALTLCATLIKRWNKPQDRGYLGNVERMIQKDYKELSQVKFLEKYLHSAWIISPVLTKTTIK